MTAEFSGWNLLVSDGGRRQALIIAAKESPFSNGVMCSVRSNRTTRVLQNR
jgi:hypothetical protein